VTTEPLYDTFDVSASQGAQTTVANYDTFDTSDAIQATNSDTLDTHIGASETASVAVYDTFDGLSGTSTAVACVPHCLDLIYTRCMSS
jgi:hypothetical protein